jgi:serine protease AprX
VLAPAAVVATTGSAAAAYATKVTPAGDPSLCPQTGDDLTNNAVAFYPADIQADAHSMFNARLAMRADAYHNYGYFGQGVDIALIDTGVSPVAGLDNGNVVHGPDLSFESQSGYAHMDTYGHGTHLASLMVGRDSTTAPYGSNSSAKFTGIAPGARVVSVKAGDAMGAVDVTQLIAAIDWVVKHRNDPPSPSNLTGFNIRVMNLSFGFDASKYNTAEVDALSFAVEQAWKAGIVVVAADGNGFKAARKSDPGLTSPAFNRWVLAVGAYDPATNRAPDFASGASSSNTRLPDFVTPGQSIPGLRVPGAFADEEVIADCKATVAAGLPWTWPVMTQMTPWGFGWYAYPGRLLRASGTSQSAALASAGIALMLSKNPSYTPDRVKAILRKSAQDLGTGQPRAVVGEGRMDLAVAYSTTVTNLQSPANAIGGSALNNARAFDFLWDGTYYQSGMAYCPPLVHDGTGYRVSLTCDRDIFGNSIDLAALQAAQKNRAAWRDVTFDDGTQGEVWFTGGFPLGKGLGADEFYDPATGNYSWQTSSAGAAWIGRSWSGRRWSNSTFSGRSWSADGFVGRSWSGRSWSDHDWSGRRWSGRSWSADDWVGRSWSGRSWSGRRWSDHAWRDHTWS